MFGQNEKLKVDNEGDGQTLRIVKGSPFLTIQGEGPYAGEPAVFIRLHGCNLACTFCDTQFSDPNDPVCSIEEIVLAAALEKQRRDVQLVVITGGEPLRQNIKPLCKLLCDHFVITQIETAGTCWVPGIEQWADIVCSPKTPTIHPKVLEFAMAFKYVISERQQFDGFLPITATQEGARPARLAAPRRGAPVYLSPMDAAGETESNIRLVGRMALAHNVHAGVQLHKLMGLE